MGELLHTKSKNNSSASATVHTTVHSKRALSSDHVVEMLVDIESSSIGNKHQAKTQASCNSSLEGFKV